MSERKMPLKCTVVDGAITFTIGADILAFAAANHPSFWDGISSCNTPNIKVTDPILFAREVCREINKESETGETPLTDMLDNAIESAVEGGCEGVDHEYE